MELNPIALAIPIFFALIGLEFWMARRRGVGSYYRFNDAITDLSCGVGSQVMAVMLKVVFLYIATTSYEEYAFITLPTWAQWVVALFGVDFMYYWWHRASHRVNFLWAGHIVHHHSEDYNLAVALRQSIGTALTNAVFMIPVSLLGVSPLVLLTMNALNTLYQFWIHTRLIGKLGPVEWIMNTPSHHRVHHGINPQYIDTNYAGIFIIWDRMFGTFVPEEEEVVYGTVRPLKSWNPVWAQLSYYAHLVKETARLPGLKNKIWVWFAPPEWTPTGPKEIPEVSVDSYTRWDLPMGKGVSRYIAAHFAVNGFVMVWLLMASGSLGPALSLLVGGSLVLATLTQGLMLENRPWAVRFEQARLFSVPLVVAIVAGGAPWMMAGVGIAAGWSVLSLLLLRGVELARPAAAVSGALTAK